MATFECYACSATIREGMRTCVGCGAEQTKSALETYRAQRSVRAQGERWKLIAGVIGIICFAAGAAFGMLAARQAPAPAVAQASMPVKLTVEQANDAFLRSLNETIGLGAVSWVWAADSTLVLEIQTPTAQQQVLWQTLDATERQQVMAFVSIAYTRALIAAGATVDLAGAGHPPLVLQYRGVASPLASRDRSGAIQVFASPFDHAAVGQAPVSR